ncbi:MULTISPECIES: hypothetical protein [unclassified Streptomyces]|uniref:hypothetical protein n=1 Tax=unclassified Streptomyces TaxID=2593676 RepID=UPI001F0470AE|nr:MULTISPECIES: hypothetical protein [unclassified Streptomyces]MCH0564969.1 hypothetical protein [Streptomyces sp. MUM 2J]MCH0569969.1 hypothetical protein [Streptomyces sp. MUM 136J]
MAASAHLLLSALSKPDSGSEPGSAPAARPTVPRPAMPFEPESSRPYIFSSEGTRAEIPLTSEPPLPDAEPLTSEPPLADAAPLTSESDAEADPAFPRP